MAELIIGFLLILASQIGSLKLRQIRISPKIRSKPFQEVLASTDYMTFNNRGSALAARVANASKK